MFEPTKSFDFEDAVELAQIAKNRLRVTEISIEYLWHRDQYDNDELNYSHAIETAWSELTQQQKQILHMRLVQGFTFTSIGDFHGFSRKNASNIFYRACKHIQNHFHR